MRLTAFDRRLESHAAHPIAVAVSGGADSLLALIETAAWARARDRTIVALSVDHGLQAGSAAWTTQAGEAATRLGCTFKALAWTGAKPTHGIAAAARQARHILLADAARSAGARVIVTGHTGDDALENAALGQGALSEWSPSPVWPQGRGLCLLRPLLAVRRAAIRERLAGLGWTWVDDPANTNGASPRIAARLAIASGGKPPTVPDLTEIAALASTASFAGGVLSLPRDALRKATPDVRRRVVAAAALSAGGGQRPPRGDRAERLADRLAGPEVFVGTLAGAKLIAGADEIGVLRNPGELARGGLTPVDLPGVWDGRYALAGTGKARTLSGLSARLPAVQRRALAAVPAAARGSLPVVVDEDGQVTCPVLAAVRNGESQSLVLERFLTACGVNAHERDL